MPIFDNELLSNSSDREYTPDIDIALGSTADASREIDTRIGIDLPGQFSEPFQGITADQARSFKGGFTPTNVNSPFSMVSKSELLANQRYPLYERGVNLENIYGLQQSGLEQLGNGLIKMGANALGSFAQSFATTPNTISAIKNGSISDLSNPDGYESTIDTWLRNVENYFPNYVTEYEKQRGLATAIPFTYGSANFWGDKILKNSGFMVGAIAGSIAQDAIIGAVTDGIGAIPLVASQLGKASLYLNKLFSGTNKVDRVLDLARAAGKSEQTLLNIKKLGQLAAAQKLTNGFRYGMSIYGSARTEAAIESRESYRTIKEQLTEQYKLENLGQEPIGEDLQQIEEYATDAMNTRFGINMALLTVSNAVQFDNIFKSFTGAQKGITSSALKDFGSAGKIGLKEGTLDTFEKKLPETLSGKAWEFVKPKAINVFTEGVYEEGGQFAAQIGVEDYYTRKYKNKESWDFVKEAMTSTTKGLAEQFGSSAGIESMVIGGITAAVTGPIADRISGESKKQNERLNTTLNILNQYGMTGVLSNKYEDTSRSVEISKQMNDAVKSGNVFKFKNLKADMFFGFVNSKIPLGMHDVTIEQLQMLKDLPKEEFEKTFGMDFNNSNKNTVSEYVDALITKANSIKNITTSIDFTFNNPYNRIIDPKTDDEKIEAAKFQMFENWKTDLSHLSYLQEDSNDRLNEIQTTISKVNPLLTNSLLSTVTSEKGLKELSDLYEQKANQLSESIANLSPVKRAEKRNEIKKLRTLSEKINIALNTNNIDPKLFNELINFELSGQDFSQPNALRIDETSPLKDYAEDLHKINSRKEQAAIKFEDLSSEKGFDKYFTEEEEIANTEIPLEDLSIGLTEPTFVNKNKEKEKLKVGREYAIDVTKEATAPVKIADDRYRVTAPDGTVSFHKTRKEAVEESNALTEENKNLFKVKVIALNDDGTVKIEDVNGDILNIDPKRLYGYEELETEQEKLQKNSEDVKKQQDKIVQNSGTVSTPNTSAIIFAEEDPKKSWRILFTSSTTESETNVDDKEYTQPHISRARRFLNKLKTFKNKEKVKAILLTAKQAEELGIGDIVKDSYKVNRESSIDDIKDVNSTSKGWVAQVFVIKEKGKVYFIDEQGNKLTTPDVDKIVFQTMPTTSLQWRNGQNRFRAGEEKEAEAASRAWEKYRKNLFNLSAKAVMNKVFDFTVSRGIPNEIKINGKKESNNVGGILISEELIPTQNNLIVIPTTGTISHQGELIKFPNGVPVLQYEDTLQQLNNRTFSKEESKTIFEVLKELSSQIITSTSKGQKINISNNDLVIFLQNVLYWRNLKAEKGNHIFINSETMEIQIGDKTYPISEVANNEKDIIDQLGETYHNVNNKTLSNSLSDTFIQYYFEGNDLKQREWSNYQTYLLASKTPEGKSHSAVLTTSVAKETDQVPSFIAKYSTLDLSEEIEIIIPETKEEEAPKEEGKLNDEELTKQANAYIASLITKSVQSEETPTNKTIDIGTFGKVSYEIDGEGNPLIVDDENYKNTLKTIVDVAKARQSKKSAEPKTEVSEVKLDNTSVNSTPVLTFGNVKFKATSADDFTIDWEDAETDKTANAILDKVSSADTKNTPKDVLLAQTKGLIEQKVKQKIQEVQASAQPTAATFTPTTPYGTPTGPEITTASTAPVSDEKADIVQTYEYKGKTQTVKKQTSTKDGVTKVTFVGERSDKPGAVIGGSGYVYGGPTSNSVQQFFNDYGITVEDIAEDLSINDIKAIKILEERTGEGKTAITFRITYSQEMGGMSSEPMEMAVKKQKFTSDAELAALGQPTTPVSDIEAKKQKAIAAIRKLSSKEIEDREAKMETVFNFISEVEDKTFAADTEEKIKEQIDSYYNDIIYDINRPQKEKNRLNELKSIINKLGEEPNQFDKDGGPVITYDRIVEFKKLSDISGKTIEEQLESEIEYLKGEKTKANTKKFGSGGYVREEISRLTSILDEVKKINTKYDAELSALEGKPTPVATPVSDIEAKKADNLKRGDIITFQLEEYQVERVTENSIDIRSIKTGDTDVISKEDYNAELSALEGGEEKPSINEEPASEKHNVKNIKGPSQEFRKVGKDVKDRMTDEELELFKEWHAANVPNIPYDVLENIIIDTGGEKNWGVFEDGVAKFVRGGLRGTEYHEIFEGIWKGMLSPTEQQDLLDEFKSKSGTFTDRETGKKIKYSEATDKEAKERIADDFSDYRLGKLPARSLGEKVRRFFKTIMDFFKSFVTKPSLKEELFKAIDTGKFKERTLDERAYDYIPEYRKIGNLTEEETHLYVQDIKARVLGIIFKEGDKTTLFSPERITSDYLFDKVEAMYEVENRLNELGTKAWEELKNKTKESLRSLGISFDIDNKIDINSEERTKNDYAPEPFSLDVKKSSTIAIKALLSSLIERIQNGDREESFDFPEAKLSKVLGYQLVNYSKAFATVLDKLSNTTDKTLAIQKIIELADSDSNYIDLFKKLGGNLLTKSLSFKDFKMVDWRLFIDFFQTFTKQKPEALIQYKTGPDVYIGVANLFSASEQTKRSWIENIKALSQSPEIKIPTKLKGADLLKWVEDNNYSFIYFNNSTKTYQINNQLFDLLPFRTIDDQIKLLNKAGIEFDRKTFNKLNKEQKTDFNKAVSSIKKYFGDNNDLMSISKETLGINGPLNTLAELYNKVNNSYTESTYFGVNGERIGSYSENNYSSVFENEFNESETIDELLSKRPELQDVYSKGSQILKKGGMFFDKDGNRIKEIKVKYIQGTKEDNKGITTSKLTLGARFTQEINQNINGDYYVIIPADSTTEWMMSLGNQIDFKSISNNRYLDKVYSIFKQYLLDDVNLALENRNYLKATKNNAKELRFFKDILSEKNLTAINELISKDASFSQIEKYIEDNIDTINNSVKELIDNINKESIDVLKYNREIYEINNKETNQSEFVYRGLLDTFTKENSLDKFNLSEKELNDVMSFVNINYIINNIEYHKILFGDPYQFDIKKDGSLDELKRIKSFLSPRRTTFDSPELNTFLNQNLNKVGEVQLTKDDYGFQDFKEYVNTITLKDNTIVGSLHNIISTYGDTKETDGFSWLMDGTYREVKIKNRQWDDNQEAWHQWQMAYTRQNIPGYKYSSKELEAYDKKLVSKKAPKNKIEVLKPIVTGNKFGENKFDIVLDKFSQMPIYYSMVKGTNLEKLYIQMFNENVGYAVFESGRKVGTENVHSLYNADGSLNESPFTNKIKISWKSYGIQVETISEDDKTQTRGSQITKLGSIDLFDNGVPISEEAEKEYKRNTDLLNRMHQNAYNELLISFGVKDLGTEYIMENGEAVSQTLLNEMLRRALSDNAIETLKLDENNQFKIPFEASPSYIQIRSILYSAIHKALNSPTMSGGSHVQAPVTGFEKGPRKIAIKTEEGYRNITRKEFEALNEEQKSKVVLTDDTLKFYENKDGERVCEIMVPHWFKSNLGKHSKKTDEELINFLNTHPEGKQILSGIGFRIPTQSMSSIEVFRVKGFLPQYMGSTVVVPSEITTKAGSDFDIDKLNMYLKSIYIDSNGEIKLVKLINNNEAETKEFYKKVYEDTIQKEIYKLEKYDEFRETLFKIFDSLEGLTLNLTPEQQEFYDVHEDLINEIISQADDEDVLPSEYMLNQINRLAQAKYDLSVTLINEEIKEKYVKKMYKKALENEYYDSLEKLVTLPENFDRLIAPVDDAGLKDVAKDLDKLRGINEAGIKNKLINRNFLTNRRNSFLTGKKWVGIVAVNITNLSLKQKSQVYLDVNMFNNLSLDDQMFLGDGSILLDHNTTIVNGEPKVSLSGTKTADGSEYISSRLSGYATAVVDVAKDDYITRIINGDLVIGTFMFLENIGAGKQAALFLNQPIIQEYLNMLNSKNSKTLFNKGNIKSIKNKFPVTEEFASGGEIDLSKLDKNIEKYYKDQTTFSIEENAEQQSILNEFLKYAKMAEFNFKFTQATNYDTTKFGNSEELFRKQLKTNNARNNNIFSSVDNILNNTFIGVQSELLDKSMDAMAPILKLENSALRYITNKVLEAYAANDYLSGEKFNKIALGIKTSFLDYIVQTKSGINNLIKELLIDPDTNVSGQLALLKEKYPDIAILKELESVSSDRVEGAKSVKLKANIKEAYDENLYTGMMRELRDYNDETNKLYKDLVLLSVLQGSYQSAISIKNIIPLEDYADIVSKYVDNIQDVESLQAFGLGMFQRNNFKNDEIVPSFIPRFVMTQSEQERQYKSVDDSDVFTYYSRMFPSIETMNIKPNDRKVLLLSEMWDSFNLKNDFLKVNRVFSPRNSVDLIDFTTGKTITKKEIYLRKQKGDLSLQDVFGYKKVYLPVSDEQGNRIPLTHTNKNGDVFHVYKLVNLYGDGQFASEYYTTPIKSVINNGTAKIDNEIPDEHLIEYYSANQPIFEEIEEESTIVKPESSVNKKSIFELRNNPITYTKGQEKALTEIAQIIDANKQGYYLLAGYAGTGKTTLAENIAKYAQESGKEVKIIAPTNKAAKVLNDKLKSTGVRAEASTIHKTIYGEPDPVTGEWVLSAKLRNSVIIIDESSMIEKDVMQDLIDSSKGNNILIFMGDSFQLEQIGKDSELFKELNKPNTFGKNYGVNINGATQLTEVKRQSLDSNILKLATLQRNEDKAYVPTESIEDFKIDHSKQDFINDFKDSVKNNEDSIMIVATNAERITMNNVARFAKYGKEKEVLEEGDKLISVANSANYSNSEIFDVKQLRGEPTVYSLTFNIKGKTSKQDCYVYYIVNDKGQEIKTLLFPTLDMPSLYHSQILEAMKESNRDMYDAFNNGMDIITTQKGKQKLSPAISIATYGYAITAHKSQGSQWNTVFVNQNYKADTWNGARWFYTAITRAANNVVVHPSSYNIKISKQDIDNKINDIATEEEVVIPQPTQTSNRKTYSGKVTSLKPNQIFVFGSNPEGRHGAGAAKYAKDNFGAVYGQGEGLQGQSYALPTKDLRVKTNNSLRSISSQDITENIKKLYEVARQNPIKEFLISDYSESNLNGYTGQEMADMFNTAGPIPSNIVFNKNFDKLVVSAQFSVEKPLIDRQIQVEQFKITVKPDGKMFYDNGKEVTDQTTINKVNVRKELQDGTLRTSIYNKANYFVLLDGRIVGSGKTNLGKESITDPKIKEAILAKAVTYKKQC